MFQVVPFSLSSGIVKTTTRIFRVVGSKRGSRFSFFVFFCFGSRVLGLGSRVSALGCAAMVAHTQRDRPLRLGLRISYFGFRVSGFTFGCRVSGSHTASRTPSAAGLAAQASASARSCAGPPPPHLEETCVCCGSDPPWPPGIPF